MIKVKYIGKTSVSLTEGKEYDVIAVENGWYRVMDDTDDDYLFAPDNFEIMEGKTKETEEQQMNAEDRGERTMNEEKLIFKAYLRGLARQLQAMKGAMTSGDYITAYELLTDLIEDTQSNIED